MKKTEIVLGIVCVMLLCVCMCACGTKEATDVPQDTEAEVNETEAMETENAGPEVEYDLTDYMTVETEYGELHYPAKWDGVVSYDTKSNSENAAPDEGGNIIEFYATIGTHEKQHVFDIAFGGDEGYCIGLLETDNGNVEVNLIPDDIECDSSWTEDEQAQLAAIQEDANFIMQSLSENKAG